jgi:hypothetical protein
MTKKELYTTVEDCYFMMQAHDTQRVANHKLNELVDEHGKETIVSIMAKVKNKNRR